MADRYPWLHRPLRGTQVLRPVGAPRVSILAVNAFCVLGLAQIMLHSRSGSGVIRYFSPSSSSPFLYRHRTKGAAMRCDAMRCDAMYVRVLKVPLPSSRKCVLVTKSRSRRCVSRSRSSPTATTTRCAARAERWSAGTARALAATRLSRQAHHTRRQRGKRVSAW